ncbi:MAG: hypothetical protein DRG09_04730 [Epsilonproteobacteria bacterium]|nr:MAG: hypothetical protein DRG09_04730 [Campylobacterota bacterium]
MNRIPKFDFNTLTPEAINEWIIQLHNAGLAYHFDDDPSDIIDSDFMRLFNNAEVDTLNTIMEAIYSVKGYDPFETLVLLTD